MKRFCVMILSFIICGSLSACSGKQAEYTPLELFSGTAAEISLGTGDSLAVCVQTARPLCGVEIEVSGDTGQDTITLAVYQYDRDYAKTITDGAVKVRKSLTCTQQHSVQTVLFGAIEPGEYLIVFSSESDGIRIIGYETAVGCTFYRNGTAQESGAAGIRLMLEA